MPHSISFIPISTVLPYFLMYLTLILCASQLAKFKNRSQVGWVILVLLFGILAVIVLLILPSLPSESKTNTTAPSIQQDYTEHTSHLASCSQGDAWWYHLEKTQQSVGPLSYEELIVFLKKQSLQQAPSELANIWLWKKGMQDWKKIKDIQEIKEVLQI